MKLIRSIASPDLPRDGCALTIGNFDAVHIGHREILRTLTAQAKQRGLPAAVMTFDPHPQEYFAQMNSASRTKSPARLTTTTTRFFALRDCGVDIMLSLKFNCVLARTDAARFVREYLSSRLRMKYLLVGDDFRFGAKRVGDFKLLEHMAQACGYEVARLDTVSRHDHRISSSWIRELLAAGELARAEELLGRKYALAGRVIHGDKRGRAWGFPTVNLAIRHEPALTGVFAVTVAGLGIDAIDGVASLGTRPTIDAYARKNWLEVYLFDYDGDAYGRRICVEFVAKIRDEEKFDTHDALKKKMAEDVQIAKALLAGDKK